MSGISRVAGIYDESFEPDHLVNVKIFHWRTGHLWNINQDN